MSLALRTGLSNTGTELVLRQAQDERYANSVVTRISVSGPENVGEFRARKTGLTAVRGGSTINGSV